MTLLLFHIETSRNWIQFHKHSFLIIFVFNHVLCTILSLHFTWDCFMMVQMKRSHRCKVMASFWAWYWQPAWPKDDCSMTPYKNTEFSLRFVIMSVMASQITSLTIVYSTVYSGADQRKHQSSASLAIVRGIHRSPVNSPCKGPVTRKCFHLMTSSCVVIVLQTYLPLVGYPPVAFYLNKTGRPIVLSCEYPAYHHPVGRKSVGHWTCPLENSLTHRGRDKMAAIFQTTFSNAFSWRKMFKFRLRFHLSLFPRVHLTIFHHWFR